MATPRSAAARPKAQPEDGTREDYLVAALRQLESQVRKAEKDRSWTAAVQAKKYAVQVRADLDQLRETERRQRSMPASADEHKTEILAEVRRLRLGATAAGSYVAAAALLKLEREMLTVAAVEATEAEARALAERSVADLEAEIAELQAARAR